MSHAAHINNKMSFCINVSSMKDTLIPHLSPCLACKSINRTDSYIEETFCGVQQVGSCSNIFIPKRRTHSPSGESWWRSSWRQGGGGGRSSSSIAARCSWAAAPLPAVHPSLVETSRRSTGSWPWRLRSGWTRGTSDGWCERPAVRKTIKKGGATSWEEAKESRERK